MINFHEIPIVRLLLPFIVGIGVTQICDVPNLSPLLISVPVMFVVFLAFYFQYKKRVWFGVILIILIFLLGISRAQQYDELNTATHFQEQITEKDTIIAWVAEMPEVDKWVRLRLEVEAYNRVETTGSLLAYVERNSLSEALTYGSRLIIATKIFAVEEPKNPNAFDYRSYLAMQNIHYQSFVRQGDWQKLDDQQGSALFRKIYRLRVELLAILASHLKTPETLAVGSALILGYRAALPEEVRTAYAETGAIHVLAVSGLHVGLVYLLLGYILNLFPRDTPQWRILKMIISILVIWIFALLTGSSPSVLRAATMFTFVAIGDQLRRFNNIYNTLATAAFASLLYDPFLLFHVGFQLSYIAVLGIVYFHPKIMRWLPSNNKWVKRAYSLAAVSFAAQLAVSPISIYYFHQFPVWFWLSSFIVIPAAFAILTLGISLFLLTPIIPVLANLLGDLLHNLIRLMNFLIFKIQEFPYGLIQGIWLEFREIALLYSTLVALSIWMNLIKPRAALLGLLSIALFLFSYNFRKTNQIEQQRIVIYDVRKECLLDFFEGQNCYTLQTETLSGKDENFAAQQHRWSRGMEKHYTYFLEKDSLVETEHWFYESPFIQFYDQRIAIISEANFEKTETPLRVDILLIRQNSRFQIADLQELFDFQLVIFDSSNYRKQRIAWQKECEILGIKYHDIAEAGAWIWEK